MWSCPRKKAREEVEAESTNNSPEGFCWKEEKWRITLEENMGLREGFWVWFLKIGDINSFK